MGSIYIDLFGYRYINNWDIHQVFSSYCQTTWWSEKLLPPCNCDCSSLAGHCIACSSVWAPAAVGMSVCPPPASSFQPLFYHRTQLHDFPRKAARALSLCKKGGLPYAAQKCVSINVLWAGITQCLCPAGLVRSWPHHVDPKTTRHQGEQGGNEWKTRREGFHYAMMGSDGGSGNADSLKQLWHLMRYGRGKRASSLVLLLCTFCNTFITLIHMSIHLFIHSANVPGVNCPWR